MIVSILGAGAMGSLMASRLIKAGYEVNIFNRSEKSARERIKESFNYFESPKSAVQNADVVISMVTADEASKFVWLDEKSGALKNMKPGAIAIECSTLSLNWIHELSAHAKSQKITLFDAPVLGSLPQAEAGQLIFTVGADQEISDNLMKVFMSLGSKIEVMGKVGAGMATKLAANTYFAAQIVALKKSVELVSGSNVSQSNLLKLFSEIPAMSPALKGLIGLILANDHKPRFTPELISKDIRYAKLESKDSDNFYLGLIAEFEKAKTKGLGQQNITAIFE